MNLNIELNELLPDNVSKRDITLLFLTSLISAIQNGENLEDLIKALNQKAELPKLALTTCMKKIL